MSRSLSVVGSLALVAAITTAVPAAAAPVSESAAAGGGLTKLGRLNQIAGDGSYYAWVDEYNVRRTNKWKFDWSTDGCSHAPDDPDGFNFYWACYRHDFGYRNYKALVGKATFNKTYKARVDDAFLLDMQARCLLATLPNSPMRGRCNAYAKLYYNVVKKLGN